MKNGIEPRCKDCGTVVVTGVRCRDCNGRHIAMQHAQAMETHDRQLLAMVQDEQLSAARLGDRLGISRVAADMRIRGAKKRLAMLQEAR